jgi:hypothetical protein
MGTDPIGGHSARGFIIANDMAIAHEAQARCSTIFPNVRPSPASTTSSRKMATPQRRGRAHLQADQARADFGGFADCARLSAACSYRGAGDIHRPSTQSDVEHVSAEQINRSD